MESFIYHKEELSSAHGIAGYLLLTISKNSNIAGSFKHHYCTTFYFCDNRQLFFTVTFTGSKRTQMNNFNKYRAAENTFQALSPVINWMINFSFYQNWEFPGLRQEIIYLLLTSVLATSHPLRSNSQEKLTLVNSFMLKKNTESTLSWFVFILLS